MVPKEPQTWILQFHPQQLDLPGYLQEIQAGKREKEGEWPVHRYFKQMQAGDRLIFWQSGAQGGIYALGGLTSSAYILSEPEDGRRHYIGYRVAAALRKPLLRETLRADATLKELAILRRPQSRVFQVMPEEWTALEPLLKAHGLHPLKRTPSKGFDLQQHWKQLQKSGLRVSETMLRRYHVALASGPLVILCGVSGIGKTWLTEVYARSIGAAHCLIPVSPHWLSPEDLLGYFNPLENRYYDTPFIQFVQQAGAEYQRALEQGTPPRPYHAVLDEMNLARVEHYLAPLLSLLEVRRRQGRARLPLSGRPPLDLPPNLFIIGTINMDHTTQAFADKVLDRAQILELQVTREDIMAHLPGFSDTALLLDLWEMLLPFAPFAYRSLDEIRAYIQGAQQLGASEQNALDEAILHKILPRLRGQGTGFGQLLTRLKERLSDYPLCLAKMESMQSRYQRDGFSSFF